MVEQINTVIVLRNDSTTAWETSSYQLRSGEIGVGYMDRVISRDENGEPVEVKQVPIIKVGDGEHAWKDLPQAEGVFEDDQILTYNFGRHITSNGYVNAGGKGMTTSEWILDALSETKDPVVVQPSFTLSAGTITTTTGNKEIGSKIKSIKWDGTFAAGSYEYGSKIGDEKYTDTETGVTATYEVTCSVEGTHTDGEDGTFTLNPQIVIESDSSTTFATITNKCTWGDSPRTPVNNVGVEVSDKKILGSFSEKTTDFSITGYREGFFYGTVETAVAASDIDYKMIRALSKTGAKYTKGDKTVSVPVGAASIILACPKTKTGVTNVLNTTVNAGMNDAFGLATPTVVSVGGADATDTSIGDYAEDYNVWVYTPAEPYGSTTSLTVTLG